MLINQTLLTTAIHVAKQVFAQQTSAELATLKAHRGKTFDESTLVAEIAVKLILRLGGIPTRLADLRVFSPVDALVAQAEQAYRQTYSA